MANGKKTDNREARRRILKTIAGVGGAFTAGSMLPEKWTRPVVDQALLPAHAQTSTICTEICNLDIEFNWTPNTNIDYDLEVLTPGGHLIAPKVANGDGQGNCLQHDGDDPGSADNPASEVVSNIGMGVSPGHYVVFIRNNSTPQVSGLLTISGCHSYQDAQVLVSGNNRDRIYSFDIPSP